MPPSPGHPLFAVLIGWERNNVYQILDSNNQQFLTAKEGKAVTGNLGGFQLHLIFVPLLFDDLPSWERSYTSSLGSPLLDLLLHNHLLYGHLFLFPFTPILTALLPRARNPLVGEVSVICPMSVTTLRSDQKVYQ